MKNTLLAIFAAVALASCSGNSEAKHDHEYDGECHHEHSATCEHHHESFQVSEADTAAAATSHYDGCDNNCRDCDHPCNGHDHDCHDHHNH